MKSSTFTFNAEDGTELFAYCWLPETPPRAIVMIAHGMAEHAGRYERFANALTGAGFAVYAEDHRGHGKTAKTRDELGAFAQDVGFMSIIGDMATLLALARSRHTGKKAFLFGHSMGSFLARAFLAAYGSDISGCMLSATRDVGFFVPTLCWVVSGVMVLFRGKRKRTIFFEGICRNGFDKKSEPARTRFDWLSRDPAEVDRYIADSACGFAYTIGFYRDFARWLVLMGNREFLKTIPRGFPLYFLGGDRDPVGSSQAAADTFVKHGFTDVESNIYPGGRHEMLNETNRDEVMKDTIQWIKKHC